MDWQTPDWLDEYDVLTAATRDALLRRLNTEGRKAAESDKHGRWEIVGIAVDATGQYHALRRRGIWACPSD